MSTPEQPRIWQSHVWHQGTCFYVSTIERAFETAEGKTTGPETLVWEYDWTNSTRGKLLHQADGVRDHQQICRCLIAEGQFPDENNPATARFCETELQQAQAALAALTSFQEWCYCHAVASGFDELKVLLTNAMADKTALAAVTLERDEAKRRIWEDGDRYTSEACSLRAQLAACQSREAKQSARIRYLEGATNHATGTPLSKAEADRDQLQAQVGALRGALGLLDVWPLHSVLGKLCEAVRHMKEAHDCDGDGHEQFYHALAAGERLIPLIRAALAHPAPAAPDSLDRQIDKLVSASRAMTNEERKATDAVFKSYFKDAPAAPDSAKDGARLIWAIDHTDQFAAIIDSIKWTGDADRNRELWRAAIDAAMSSAKDGQ